MGFVGGSRKKLRFLYGKVGLHSHQTTPTTSAKWNKQNLHSKVPLKSKVKPVNIHFAFFSTSTKRERDEN